MLLRAAPLLQPIDQLSDRSGSSESPGDNGSVLRKIDSTVGDIEGISEGRASKRK
jgi:hypothetical protein